MKEIKTLLSSKKNIVITMHKNPDCDALGSSLGLAHILSSIGHYVKVMPPNNYPDFLKWLPGQDYIKVYDENVLECQDLINNSDVVFCLDFNNIKRLGDMQFVIAKSQAFKILIDHHQDPFDFCDFMFSFPDKSSTCEIIYDFAAKLNLLDNINSNSANCLYAGMVTDTGGFAYSCVTSETLRVASFLINKGADVVKINQSLNDYSYNRLKLLGYSIFNKTQYLENLKTSIISLTVKELSDFDFQKGDTEGIVNYGLSIKDCVLAVFFIEQDKMIKISFRSKGNFDVNVFARKYFNGGGHVNAAGGMSKDTLDNTINYFKELLLNYSKDLNE